MEKNIFAVECADCVHLTKTTDKRGWLRYRCKYAPNIEWLGGMCRDPLNPECGKHERKVTVISLLKKKHKKSI